MNDIKFSCPQCGQRLTVPPSGANMTVACPNCGQAIVVPPLARAVAAQEKPKRALWIWIAAAGVVLLLAGVGFLLWQTREHPSALAGSVSTKMSAGNATDQTATPEFAAARAKQLWTKALNNALHELQNNDLDTANFVSDMLALLNRSGGSTPEALAADTDRMNNKVRELVQRDALESAAILQDAIDDVLYAAGTPPGPPGPANPNHKTGGLPGPGGLVLYLPFDQPADADGTVHDESGTGNDGKVFGAQWVADGKFGGAYQFHITNLTDRIVIPNSDTLNPDYITIAAWIKTGVKNGFWTRIADKDYRNSYCFDLGGDWRGKATRGKPGLETSRGEFRNNRPLDDNRWHHVAVTFDGRRIACFIDGVEQSSQVRRPGPLKKDDWDLCIGNSVVDYGTGDFLAFDGLIDEVRIYNRALSPDEILCLATATRPGVDIIGASETREQRTADRLKARRIEELANALNNLQTNDPVSANLVSNILASFDQPDGLAAHALTSDVQRMKARVRELVIEGSLDNAAILNRAQVNAFWGDTPAQPASPRHKPSGAPGPGGLVLYFPFDAPATNDIVQDESGAGNDGQVFGAEWVPDGKFGGAYRFSLTNFDNRIVVPNSDSLNPGAITVAAWIKSSGSYKFWRRIVDKDCWHGYCFSLSGALNPNGQGKPVFEGQFGVGSDHALDDNQWHHVAATFDGQTARCYIDGVETSSHRARNPGPLKPDDWDLCIGNSVPDFGGELLSFDGLIDEVRIYNRALSPDEIMSLATAAQAGINVPAAAAQAGPDAATAARLKQVKDLYDQGLITKDQYDQKVKEIMGSL